MGFASVQHSESPFRASRLKSKHRRTCQRPWMHHWLNRMMRHLQVVYLNIQYQDCHQQLTWRWRPPSALLVDDWMTCSPRRLAPISSTTSHWRGSWCLSLPCMMGQVIHSTIRCIYDNWWRWILATTCYFARSLWLASMVRSSLGSTDSCFYQLFSGCLKDFCKPLPMFCSTKVEHKHHVEHQDAGKRIAEGLYEAIRTSGAPNGVLQYGRYLTNFQTKHQPEYSFFESLVKKLSALMDDLFTLEDDVQATS